MTAVMSLSFLAHNKLQRDTHLAVPDKQVESSLSQKKMRRVKGKKRGRESSFNSYHSSRCIFPSTSLTPVGMF